MKKLQYIQNKGTRFIKDVRITDRVSSRNLHNSLKLDAINVRISKLNQKLMYKIYETYCVEDELLPQYVNCYSDFLIEDQPIKEKSQTLAKRIVNNIYVDHTQCPWHDPPDIHNWISPQPIYT